MQRKKSKNLKEKMSKKREQKNDKKMWREKNDVCEEINDQNM